VLRSLDHPHIVRLQDAGRDRQLIWLAMDWIGGRTLAAVIEEIRQRRGQLGIRWIRDQLVQVLQGLDYLHNAGIVHRDLKPGNILIDISGKVYLTDMGLAKVVDGATVGTELTRTGSVMGSWHYMAPEQHQGGKITAAVDIYAFGVIWYELLTGQRPMGAFSRPSCHRDDLPPDWDRWVFACLAPDATRRPTAEELVFVLSDQPDEVVFEIDNLEPTTKAEVGVSEHTEPSGEDSNKGPSFISVASGWSPEEILEM
jgi:serine/threonine protein kinase